jgi:hypothetical protein
LGTDLHPLTLCTGHERDQREVQRAPVAGRYAVSFNKVLPEARRTIGGEAQSHEAGGKSMVTDWTLEGEKLYQRRAREAFPILVRQAKAEEPISYEDLASELGMPNVRNLNHILGVVGYTVQALGDAWGTTLPPLHALVVQKQKDRRVPGSGIGEYFAEFPNYEQLPLREKRALIRQAHARVFAFTEWDTVLEVLKLPPSAPPLPRPLSKDPGLYGRGGGEGEDHRRLKEAIATGPKLLGNLPTAFVTSIEYCLPTGDVADLLIETQNRLILVEVKGVSASHGEILRGLFQCVKYHALLRALTQTEGRQTNVTAILALGSGLPRDLIAVKNTLGIDVREHLDMGAGG